MPIGPLKNLPVFRQGSARKIGSSFGSATPSIKRDSFKSAKTSINRAQNEIGKVSTSISHPDGYGSRASVSISHPAVVDESLSRDQMGEEERDDLRYNYIRSMVRARKDKEKEEIEKATATIEGTKNVYGKSVKKVGFKTGTAVRMTGEQGMKAKLNRLVRENPVTYKNLSVKDREVILKLIDSHAKKLRVGTGFGRLVRKSMKSSVRKEFKKGNISRQDSKDFKKIIDQLPH